MYNTAKQEIYIKYSHIQNVSHSHSRLFATVSESAINFMPPNVYTRPLKHENWP